ncbi:MAG: hypothetical protein U0793_27550 [Gemmataceae bacterium]
MRTTVAAVKEWRQAPGAIAGKGVPSSLLRHADEQTAVGLWAVQKLFENSGVPGDLASWGVIASGTFFGREAQANGTLRFRDEGAWGVSPNLIPHHSTHALSGTISLALGCHGANFGVGGGANAVPEAFLTAAALMQPPLQPGLLLILTGFADEFVPSLSEPMPGPDTVIQAAVLALEPAPGAVGSVCEWRRQAASSRDAARNDLCLDDLIRCLQTRPAAASWRLAADIRLDVRLDVRHVNPSRRAA